MAGIIGTAAESEKSIESYLCRMVKEKGGLCFKFVSPAHRGVPDRLIVMPIGRVLFVEVKKATGTLSALQAITLRSIAAHGGVTHVVYSRADVDAILSEWVAV